MAGFDDQIYRKLDKKQRPCNYCGKLGHTKAECKKPKRGKETRCKVCAHQGYETMSQAFSDHCPGSKVKCLQRFTGRKQLDPVAKANPSELSLIFFDVPTEINPIDFGKQLMKQIGAAFTWNQYKISRPWQDDPWREKWVRVTFMDLNSKNKFIQKSYLAWVNMKPRFYSSYSVKVVFNKEPFLVQFRHDLYEEANNSLGKVLKLKDHYEGLNFWPSACPVVSWHKKVRWDVTSEESIDRLVKALDAAERKARQPDRDALK